jgi:anti-sigma factor RsiW
MNVTREVILDLLPVYLAGEASDDTRKLVEEYIQQHPEMGLELRRHMEQNLAAIAPAAIPPELELQALRRTRGVLARQRWLFGLAIFFSLMPFSGAFFPEWGDTSATLLAQSYPAIAAFFLIAAIALWTVYYISRRRSRSVV